MLWRRREMRQPESEQCNGAGEAVKRRELMEIPGKKTRRERKERSSNNERETETQA